MTFCASCKQDIVDKLPESACCMSARLYGMLLFARSFTLERIACASEHKFVVEQFAALLLEMGLGESEIKRTKSAREYSAALVTREGAERVFADFGYSGDEPSVRIITDNFLCERCAAEFVAGAFLTGGSVTRPTSGYHLEFTTHKKNLCDDFETLLASEGFGAKRTSRGYLKVLYYKSSGVIEDLLTYMGASDSALDLMNAKIYKDIVNSVNRRTNCESANIDKTVNSAAADAECIELIKKLGGLQSLSDELRELAVLRVEQPELSMSELGALTDPPLTKSGVSHRLRKLRRIADDLKHEHNER